MSRLQKMAAVSKPLVLHSSAVLLRCALIYTGVSQITCCHVALTGRDDFFGKDTTPLPRCRRCRAEGVECPSVRAQCWGQQHAGPVANCR